MQRDRRRREERVLEGLRRLQYPHLDELPSIDSILEAGKLRYQLLEWLFHRYDVKMPHTTSKSSAAECSQVDRLTLWASLLGLVFDPSRESSTDEADRLQRLQMLEELVDMVEIASEETDADEIVSKDIKFAQGLIPICKDVFSAHLRVLPEDMQFKLEEELDLAQIERECLQKESLIADLRAQLQEVVQDHTQSVRRMSKEDLVHQQQRILAFKERADRFCETYSAELRTWIVQGSKLEETKAFQENSTLMAERLARTSERHQRVKKMLDDFLTIKRCSETAARLLAEASFMEDRDSENLLREERVRQLRDEVFVLDQAVKRLGTSVF